MTRNKIVLIYFLIISVYAKCNLYSRISNKIEKLRERSNRTCEKSEENVKAWNTEEVNLESPHDRQNSTASSDLLSYYNGTANLQSLTNKNGHLPSKAVVAYEGALAKLPCTSGSPEQPTWMYARSLDNLTFAPLEDKDTIVEDKDYLSIYNARSSDGGVYRCQTGSNESGLVVLEVVDDEYDVVKPLTSHGPYATPPLTLGGQGLTAFSTWTAWSECSTCGRVGRRRRYAMCYVRPTGEDTGNLILSEEMKILEDFPDGLPCRSKYLPEAIRSLPDVKQRRNEIMIGLCKVPCVNANQNFGGFHPQQPSVVRDIVFAKAGQTVKLRCPGALLRDSASSWRVRGARVCARALAERSGGRARLDARGRLVLAPAVRPDTNVYRSHF